VARQAAGRRSPAALSVLRDDRALRDGLNARHYAAAEGRLGRKLTDGERKVDVVGILTELEAGKQRLADAIRKEQRRVAGHASHGRTDVEMKITPEMVAALNRLHELGRREAVRELARHGVKAARSRTYAGPRSRRVAALINRLAGHLPTISVRVRRRAVEVTLAQESQRAVLRAAGRVPGALDAASRLVSSSFYAGMGDVFSASSDLIQGWSYSAVLDGGTCDTCSAMDGTTYDSWDEAQGDMPDGGPNPDCDGDGRCRCRLVPTGPGGV
jgi:BMFP domain-containing protein YqiC